MIFARSLRRARALGLALLTLAAAPAAAQTSHDEQMWTNLTVQASLAGPLIFFAEVQPRIGDRADGLEQLLLRPAIGWQLSPRLAVYQGYGYVLSPAERGRDLREHRSFQQVSWIAGKPFGGELSSRTRLEQRWRNDGDDMGWRLREMVRLEVPVRAPGKIAALGYAEAFVALDDTDWGARKGFDQLRSFVGAEIGMGGKSTMELGYLNQYIDQAGGRSRMNHVLSLSIFVRP
ncbi:DUF2490 domain-containing protein [Sphingomonas sanxanigenens]|uniref:DUF2490 domain-containing protein n=1 Tax=Sphingomonas sanxanigenens DSM 19645 = NX02 TaxID=1123269 RepID=W0A641_9SPHN|nr:DUF2490 domain-containing protein [Sphingomonas sanxanigenens]AHE52501.1 hypothetical protein NX02_03735 [Sphingomonas sanxanigenens DSM 19645 = NX02]